MADRLAVIIRFSGDPDDLLERAIVSGWETAVAHRAFGQGLHTHIEAAGMGMPDQIERMRIASLDWD